jgi:6-pyruvoyltetrahydropterin/6-carboxytetrahydropterin synthase
MYKVTVKQEFSGAHYLRGYKGKCENLHGHNWKVEATVGGNELNEIDLLFDFGVLKKILQKILDEIDHKLLNEHPAFVNENPSAEKIAKFVFDGLHKEINVMNLEVVSVRVSENDSSWSEYCP